MIDEKKFKDIDEYINSFPNNILLKLYELKNIIKEVAPNSIETMSYQMPTFKTSENLVHFAAYKNHIGFYPTPSAILYFKEELLKYKTSKGAIQFPINEPLPLDLIKRIVEFRLKNTKK